MLSCYFPITGSSDLKKDKIGGHCRGHGGAQRHQVHSWLQRLRPFGLRVTNWSQGIQSQGHGHIDQVEKGSDPKDLKESAPKGPKESFPKDPKEASFNTLEEVVDILGLPCRMGNATFSLPFCAYTQWIPTSDRYSTCSSALTVKTMK